MVSGDLAARESPARRCVGDEVSNPIAEATKDCPREDCSVSYGAGMTTCMGWTPTYDKSGKRTDQGDPNITSYEMACATCGQRWLSSSQYGQTTVTKAPIAPDAFAGKTYTVSH